jgi:methyltransferase (TIGR00027 family)
MAQEDLTGAAATMLATLHGRAVDAASRDPILGDAMAAEALRRLDVDVRALGLRRGDAEAIALRARAVDRWAGELLTAHPRATVLHLGCGLDSRVFRLDPGPGVRWFEVDQPEVVALRRRVYPARAGCELVAASVTDPAWLEAVPTDAPVLLVAEGLTMYLTPEDGTALLRRVVDHSPSGAMVFDMLSRRGIALQRFNRAIRAAGATVHWGVDDGAELEAVHPRLRVEAFLSALDLEQIDRARLEVRLLARVGRRVPAMRRVAGLYRLAF